MQEKIHRFITKIFHVLNCLNREGFGLRLCYDSRVRVDKEKKKESIFESIKLLSEGLYYMSETDAKVFAFEAGKVEKLDKVSFAKQTGEESRLDMIDERGFEEFFCHVTRIREWFSEQEIKNAEGFKRLQEFMEEKLRELKVFRVGRIEIDIYVVGLDDEGKIFGVRTQAVET